MRSSIQTFTTTVTLAVSGQWGGQLSSEDKPISPAESAGDTTESDQTRWKKERKTPLIPRNLLLSAGRTGAPPQGPP